MNISGSNLPVISGGDFAAQVHSASLSKNRQLVEGKIALNLIEAVGASTPVPSPATSSSMVLGSNIDIYV